MDMRLAWATDVHWNFAPFEAKNRFFEQLYTVKPDALLVTGDVAEAASVEAAIGEMREVAQLPVYWVAGNHDYYDTSVDFLRTRLQRDEHYLTNRADPLALPGAFALCGVDGWYDVTNGHGRKSTVGLMDFLRVSDFVVPHDERLNRIENLGRRDAALLKRQMTNVATHGHVLVALHVPPFPGAAWHQGKVSDPNFLPYFSSAATGRVLAEEAAKHPDRQYLVVCGHSHSWGEYQHAPNLRVLTGRATYRQPEVQGVIVDGRGFERRQET